MIKDSAILDLLESGMRAEGLRQQTIANNIANMNTEGYRRLDTNFEKILTKAIEKQGPIDIKSLDADIIQPQNTPINEYGNDVSMDKEVGEMIKNTVQHKTYMLLLKKKYQQMESAIRF